MTQPPPYVKPEVVAKTFFFQGDDDLWYWHTKALNNEIIRDGGEGYTSLRNALNGFFTQQGVAYEFGSWPKNYSALMKMPENRFQINKHLEQGN